MRAANLLASAGFRLVAWYAAVFGVSVAILLLIVYWIAVNAVEQQLTDSVNREARLLVEVYNTRGIQALERAINRRTAELSSPRRYYLLQDARGGRVAGNLPQLEPVEARRVMTVPHHAAAPGRDEAGAPESMIADGRRLSGGEYLLVGENRYRLVKAKEAILGAVAWGAPLTVLLALSGGLLLAMSYLRRIETVNRTLVSIMQGDLSQRVPVCGSGDEMDRLATSLNAMLARIQELMESVRRVSDDIAHDLRTPLSRLRQRLESARELGADRRAVLDESVAEIDAILDTFGALLRIAHIETSTRRAAFAEVDLAALCASIGEIYQPVAEDRGQRLRVQRAAASVRGDRELLFQALANLVENAIRHTGAGTEIAIDVGVEQGLSFLRVTDTGSGIPEHERGKVFRRFYRMEASRSMPGNGLGLALVKAVADLHGATVVLEDNAPGLRVCMRFAAGNVPPVAHPRAQALSPQAGAETRASAGISRA